MWGLRPDLDQRPGRGEEEEWGEPGAERGGGIGGQGTPSAQQPPAPLGLPGGKLDPGLPEHLFLRLQESGCFRAVSVDKCWRLLQTFSQHVGELWSRGRRAASALGLQTGASRASLVPPGLASEPCPCVATLSLLYPCILSRSAPSQV